MLTVGVSFPISSGGCEHDGNVTVETRYKTVRY